MERSAAERVASIQPSPVAGRFYRHAAINRDPLAGGIGQRWGKNFPVIYVGRPEQAPVAEAYRHLVEAAGVPAHAVKARILYTVRVTVQQVLDLTDPEYAEAVGLTGADFHSEVGDYDRCQAIGAAAHQLGFHGVLAPAAHAMGETLAIFKERIAASELPVVEHELLWSELPVDPRVTSPRTLRSVESK